MSLGLLQCIRISYNSWYTGSPRARRFGEGLYQDPSDYYTHLTVQDVFCVDSRTYGLIGLLAFLATSLPTCAADSNYWNRSSLYSGAGMFLVSRTFNIE